MIVDLITIKDQTSWFDFSIEPPDIDLESETARVKNVVEVRGKLKKGIVQVDVEGKISAGIEVECDRCLQPVEKSLEFPFDAAFVTADNYTQAKEAELKQDDLEVSIYAGDKIDLGELAREQIILSLPEQTFCRDDCKGLCPQCGINRNLVDCNCEEKEVDPRWQGLRELKIKN